MNLQRLTNSKLILPGDLNKCAMPLLFTEMNAISQDHLTKNPIMLTSQAILQQTTNMPLKCHVPKLTDVYQRVGEYANIYITYGLTGINHVNLSIVHIRQ